MKLYYAPGACSLATHIVLEWVGASYEIHNVIIHGDKSPELLERNPAGAVPVLEHDDWVLTQNSAILNYLAARFPEARLGGDDTPRARAEVNRWLGLVNSDVHPAYKPLFDATAYLEDAAAIDKTKDNAKQTLRKLFEILNDQLNGRSWLTGERSIADPYLFVMLRWAKMFQLDLAGFDNLERFFDHMNADPAVRKVLADEGLD